MPTGTWYVAVLVVTAKDHDTTFSAKRQAG